MSQEKQEPQRDTDTREVPRGVNVLFCLALSLIVVGSFASSPHTTAFLFEGFLSLVGLR